jgi:protein-L-isoaspartate(D-aspartate) O-methyltransferase
LAPSLLCIIVEMNDPEALPVPVPASAERVEERLRMVEEQIALPRDGRPPVADPRVLDAMRRVPRHAFVPQESRAHAYEDRPLPLGDEIAISQPYIVAKMTELLEVAEGSRVLEIGTGSGYQAAVLFQLSPHIYSIEVRPEVADRAKALLKGLGYAGVRLYRGDGARGWPEEAPFDRLILTCASRRFPAELREQLRVGGRAIYPVGDTESRQMLILGERLEDGTWREREIMPVRFVPMTQA